MSDGMNTVKAAVNMGVFFGAPIAVSVGLNAALGGRVIRWIGKELFERVSHGYAAFNGLLPTIVDLGFQLFFKPLLEGTGLWERMPKPIRSHLEDVTFVALPIGLSILAGSTVVQAIALTVPAALIQMVIGRFS